MTFPLLASAQGYCPRQRFNKIILTPFSPFVKRLLTAFYGIKHLKRQQNPNQWLGFAFYQISSGKTIGSVTEGFFEEDSDEEVASSLPTSSCEDDGPSDGVSPSELVIVCCDEPLPSLCDGVSVSAPALSLPVDVT